jgi:hypothetical protein
MDLNGESVTEAGLTPYEEGRFALGGELDAARQDGIQEKSAHQVFPEPADCTAETATYSGDDRRLRLLQFPVTGVGTARRAHGCAVGFENVERPDRAGPAGRRGRLVQTGADENLEWRPHPLKGLVRRLVDLGDQDVPGEDVEAAGSAIAGGADSELRCVCNCARSTLAPGLLASRRWACPAVDRQFPTVTRRPALAPGKPPAAGAVEALSGGSSVSDHVEDWPRAEGMSSLDRLLQEMAADA